MLANGIESGLFELGMSNHQLQQRGEITDRCFTHVHSLADPTRGHRVTRSKPSSFQPSIPPIIFLTGRPSRARRTAALSAPLQWGPAQYTTNNVSGG